MKFLKSFLYLVVVFLVLEVVETIIAKSAFDSSYFFGLLISCIQFFLFLGFVFVAFLIWITKSSFRSKKTIGFIGIFIGICGLFEIVFLYLLAHPGHIPSYFKESFFYYYDFYDREVIQFTENAVYDPELFYRLRPNANFQFENSEFITKFQTNSSGLRDDELSLKSPAVICLGDSYTMGWGVQQEDAFPQQLESLKNMKILNAGVSSYGTARESLLFEKLDTTGLQFLVIQYCTNDFLENDTFINNKRTLSISPRSSYTSHVESQKWTRKYFPGRAFLITGQLFFKLQINRVHKIFPLALLRTEPLTQQKKEAETFLDILSRLPINFKKVKVIVTIMDSFEHIENEFLSEVNKLSTTRYLSTFTNNLYTLDCSQFLQEDDYYQLDPHINKKGHKKIAERLSKLFDTIK